MTFLKTINKKTQAKNNQNYKTKIKIKIYKILFHFRMKQLLNNNNNKIIKKINRKII